MSIFASAALIILSSIILVKAVKLFIESSSKIARKMGVSGYTISFLLIAAATSLPEMVVGVTSAVNKTPLLSFGDAIGSNIALLTLVIGLPVFFVTKKGISTRSVLHSKDAYYSTLFSILPISLIIDGTLSRIDGGVLISAYVLYSIIVWRRSAGIEKILEQIEKVNLWKQTLLFIVSLALLLGSSQIIVYSALNLSSGIGLGLAFVGMTITAIGTSLPEIAFTLSAARGRHQQEILGDIVGSVVANSTIVLGLTSLICPIQLSNGKVGFSAILFLILILLIFLRFTRTKEKIDRGEAFVLLALYFAFIATEYYIQTNIIGLS